MPIELPPIQTTPGDANHRASRWFISLAPTAMPVTWAEAKRHLRLDTDEDETYVATLIAAATDFAEESMETSLMARTMLATFYAGEQIRLPRGPLISVTSVVDVQGNEITKYSLSHAGRIATVTLGMPTHFPVSVTYVAGYESSALIPASIRLAILTHVASLYANRESVSDRTKIVVPQSLADFYRLHGRTVGVR